MADLVNVAPGQCRLVVTSSSLLTLNRHQGAYIPLKIAGDWEAKLIPATAPTLANTGLTAATLYYIYAFDNAGTLTLEASTTTHAVDADTGVEIKSGDASRTLVGMVYMGAGTPGTFINSVTRRLCLNWFNRHGLDLFNVFSADRSITDLSYVEINSEIQLEYLTWADEVVVLGINGTSFNSSAGHATGTAIGIDSTTVATVSTSFTHNVGQRGLVAVSLSKLIAEGRHFSTVLGGVSGGTGTWVTADNLSNGSARLTFYGAVRG